MIDLRGWTIAMSAALVACVCATSSASAQSNSAPAGSSSDGASVSATVNPAAEGTQARAPRVRRPARNRWSMTLGWGGSMGAGGPLGLAGTFVEFRPWRYIGINAGVGGGGSFGPAIAAWVSIDPLSFRAWSLGLTANASMNFSIIRGAPITGRAALPDTTGWLGGGAVLHVRPTRTTFIRITGGYSWLLDSQRFAIATDNELASAGVPSLFFPTPFDAIRAASRNEAYGMPYGAIELGTYWRL